MVKPKPEKEEPTEGADQATEEAPTKAAAPIELDFAVNVNKLNRAKAWVNANSAGLKGQALYDAVKARYSEIGGLLRGQENKERPMGKHRGAKEVNVAPNDGSKD